MELSVYDQAGKLVRTLASGRQQPGYHTVAWDGRNESGQDVGSGVYLYRLQTAEQTIVKRMVLLR